MSRLLKILSVVGLTLLCASPVYASEQNKNRIFPTYTGMSAQVVGQMINVRSYPDKEAPIVTAINEQDVHILGQNENWYKVAIDREEGWISKAFIKVEDDEFIPYSKVLGEEVVEYGKHFIGTPYVWGGNSLKTGVDCSGLTQQLYQTFDIDISRVSYMQAKDGVWVDRSELQPGDLVFFDTTGVNNGRISHVGIYAGNGQFLHADCTHGVMLSSLSNSYYKRNYVMSSRILRYF